MFRIIILIRSIKSKKGLLNLVKPPTVDALAQYVLNLQ